MCQVTGRDAVWLIIWAVSVSLDSDAFTVAFLHCVSCLCVAVSHQAYIAIPYIYLIADWN